MFEQLPGHNSFVTLKRSFATKNLCRSPEAEVSEIPLVLNTDAIKEIAAFGAGVSKILADSPTRTPSPVASIRQGGKQLPSERYGSLKLSQDNNS